MDLTAGVIDATDKARLLRQLRVQLWEAIQAGGQFVLVKCLGAALARGF